MSALLTSVTTSASVGFVIPHKPTQIFTNNAKSTLSNVIGSIDLLIPVADSTSFPNLSLTDYALATIQNAGLVEIVKLVAPGKIGSNLIVDIAGRGWEGTTALSFPTGSRVECRITKGSLDDIVNNAYIADEEEAAARTTIDLVLQNNIDAEALLRSNADSSLTALKAPILSPTFTGIPAAPTAVAGTSTTQLATTQFVTTADNLKAPVSSPTFTGTPAAPTAVAGTSTTQLATTAFVTAADIILQNNINAITVGGAPSLIVNGVSGATYNGNHVGPVLIIYNGGMQFQGGVATIGWAFYLNGINIDGWTAVVNYQVAMNPKYYSYTTQAGAFTFGMTGYGQTHNPQFIVYYL